MDHKVIVERLENVPAYERVVDTRIPVTLQIGQLMLANVHHLDGLLSPFGNTSTGCFAVLCQSVISEWERENNEKYATDWAGQCKAVKKENRRAVREFEDEWRGTGQVYGILDRWVLNKNIIPGEKKKKRKRKEKQQCPIRCKEAPALVESGLFFCRRRSEPLEKARMSCVRRHCRCRL